MSQLKLNSAAHAATLKYTGTTNRELDIANGQLMAWVFFYGQNVVAIRESGNVSSITDNGTGLYTINFTVSMPDANYSFTGGGGRTYQGMEVSETATSSVRSVSALKIGTYGNSGLYDYDSISVLIFR